MRETQREAETQAEGEAGSMQGAGRGTRSRVSKIRPWADHRAKPLGHRTGTALMNLFFFKYFIYLFMRDTQREAETGRGRSRLPARSQLWDLILDPGITP